MKINGKEIAQKILDDLKNKVQKLSVIPNLAIILVGKDPASITYVNQKKIKSEQIGAKTSIYNYPSSISEKALLQYLNDLNHLTSVHGIIVQQPLPAHINIEKITQAIDPKKDVDGFHINSTFQMPISMAVLKILEEIGLKKDNLKSKKIVVVGKGETGGKPIIAALEELGVQPLIVDSKIKNPQILTKTADIIISAVGKPNTITPEMINNKAILIGIGLFKGKDGKLHGDYDEEKIKDIASFYTPSPGGVGPVNVAMLLKNLLKSAEEYL